MNWKLWEKSPWKKKNHPRERREPQTENTQVVCHCSFRPSLRLLCRPLRLSGSELENPSTLFLGRLMNSTGTHRYIFTYVSSSRCIHPSCPSSSIQRGARLPADCRAGIPSSPGECLPCWEPGWRLCIPWLNIPQTEILGEERWGGAQRDYHSGAT